MPVSINGPLSLSALSGQAQLIGESATSRTQTWGWNPQDGKMTVLYHLTGTEDDVEIRDALSAIAQPQVVPPDGYPTLVLQSMELSTFGSGTWLGTLTYGRRIPKATGDNTYSFDTGGGTQKITQSIGSRRYLATPPPAGLTSAPDFMGAIGVTLDSVEGTEIVVPQFNFTETHYLPTKFVTDSYKQNLFLATGKINDRPWRNFLTGEVLFLGATGTQRGHDDWEVTFKFSASPNYTRWSADGSVFKVAGTPVAKGGWDYVWIKYFETVSNNCLVKQPAAVYVETVYYSVDFTALMLGS